MKPCLCFRNVTDAPKHISDKKAHILLRKGDDALDSTYSYYTGVGRSLLNVSYNRALGAPLPSS